MLLKTSSIERSACCSICVERLIVRIALRIARYEKRDALWNSPFLISKCISLCYCVKQLWFSVWKKLVGRDYIKFLWYCVTSLLMSFMPM